MALLEERVDNPEHLVALFVQRTDAAIAEMQASRRLTEARMDEAGQRWEKERKDFNQRMDEAQQRWEEFKQERRETHQRWERERRDFNRRMADISDSVGRLIEDLVYPNAERIFGEVFTEDRAKSIFPRAKRRLGGESMEIDLLAAGARNVLLVECRRRLNAEDARELREKIGGFRRFFPEYADHRIELAVASVAIEKPLADFLSRHKIYGIALGDDTMELVNLGQF